MKPQEDGGVERVERVGPVLQPGRLANALIAAIRECNQCVEVIDRGGYLRVSAPEQCVALKSAIEAHLGHALRLPGDLEQVMPSFVGQISFSEDRVQWLARSGAKRNAPAVLARPK